MNTNQMQIVSDCPLCKEHALHVMGKEEYETQQCINCGYVSSSKFKGEKKTNREYFKLTDEQKAWAKEASGRIWIPTIMTLPMGMIYPYNDENKVMKWGYARLVDIPEDKRENYPIEGTENQYYKTMFDTDNAEIFDVFVEAMSYVNEKVKKENEKKDYSSLSELKLPKLKKVNK